MMLNVFRRPIEAKKAEHADKRPGLAKKSAVLSGQFTGLQVRSLLNHYFSALAPYDFYFFFQT